MECPRCVVILATHNGEKWLQEQLSTIYGQTGVSVRVVANDDCSTDGTRSVLQRWANSCGLEQLPNSGGRLGGANKNFLCLIRDVDIGGADYVALADQDDLWHSDKLARAVDCMRSTGAHGYSSNVKAFWPDGRTQIIKKSQSQKEWDHLFSSPGPGCTFVLQRSAYLDLKSWVCQNFAQLSSLWVHDWIIYAYVRGSGRKWLIDDRVSLLYRQHGGNDIGANSGLVALGKRLAHIRGGLYRHNVRSISRLVGSPPRLVQALDRLAVSDRLWLLFRVWRLRRSLREAVAMVFLIFIMK